MLDIAFLALGLGGFMLLGFYALALSRVWRSQKCLNFC